MEKLCRLCARPSEFLESVFSFHNNRLLSDLIAIICPIKIDINDSFPKQICDECKEIIVSSSNLRDTSVRSDLNFRTGNFVIPQEDAQTSFKIKQETTEEDPLISIFQSYSDDDWSEEESVNTSDTIKKQIRKGKKAAKPSAEGRWPCPSGCGRSFSHQTNINRHVRRFHDPNLLPIPCSQCTFRFKTKHKLDNHVIKTHQSGPVAINTETQKLEESCDVCGVNLQSPANAEEHKKKFHKEDPCVSAEKFECDLCGRGYIVKDNIEQHLKTFHMSKSDQIAKTPKVSYAGVFNCDICFKEFSFLGNVYRHKSRFHAEEQPFPCMLCNDRFRNLRNLKLHHQRFHEDEEFDVAQDVTPEENKLVPSNNCQFCGRDFQGLKRRLESHLLRDHFAELEKVLECSMCFKKFAFAETLKVHIQTHKKKIKTESFPHGCEVCGKRFLNESSLTKHVESHNEESGMTCHICGKAMSSTAALELHVRRHEVINSKKRRKVFNDFFL